jgi:TonB-linked SusC/RagA family outer membrane protein
MIPQEINITGLKEINLRMVEKITTLQEVVVVSTGYQNIPKERATGSFNIVSAKAIEKKDSPSLLERLEGISSGMLVNVGVPDRSLVKGRDNFTIRGVSTINSEKRPLIVLDGFPTELDMANINPDNIESISVLKDAAAASVWGVRAANGVIVLVSKKGYFSQNPQVSFSSIFTFTGSPRLDYLQLLNSTEYIDVENELIAKSVLPGQSLFLPNPVSIGVDLSLKLKNGTINQMTYESELQKLSKIDMKQQIQKYLLQSPFSHQYNFSITGGSITSRNFFSTSYTEEYAHRKGDYGNRLVVNFSNETKITPKLTFAAETFVTLMQQNDNGINTDRLRPYDQIVDSNGLPINFSYRSNEATLSAMTSSTGGYLPWKYNYMDELANADNTTRSFAYRLTAGLNYKINQWISADIKYMGEREFSKTRNYYNPSTYMSRDITNTYTIKTTKVRTVPVGAILDLKDGEQNNYNVRGQMNLNPDFGSAGRIDAVLGVELRQTLSSGYGNRLYGYDNRLLTSASLNYDQTYVTSFGSLKIPNNQYISNRKDRYASVYGNFSYVFKNKYSFSGSFRKDDSNLFGADSKSRVVPLWSLGGMWRAKEESFMSSVKWLSKLNLRATMGYNGNLNKTTSPYLIITKTGNDPITNTPAAKIYNPSNPLLRWERVQTFNIGTDFGILNSIITGSVDAYWRKSLDLLGQVYINSTYGFTSLLTNQLEMTSKGVDINLNGNFVIAKFCWRPTLNISYNTNRVTKAPYQLQSTDYYANRLNPIEGQELGSLYTYKFAGLDALGNAMIYKGNGEKIMARATNFDATDLGALKIAGVTNPPYYGSFSNTFTYENFELTALLTFKAGHKFLRPTAEYSQGYIHKDLADRWRKPSDELTTNIPTIQANGSFGDERYKKSDLFVEDASYIRLRDISLAYNVPVSIIRWNFIKSLNVSISGKNLALWTANKAGIDPDYLNNVYVNILPPSKSFSFSIKATF